MATTAGTSSAPAASSSSAPALGSSATPGAVVDYGLPPAVNSDAWAALMRPCTGKLQWIKPAGPLSCFTRHPGRVRLVAVSVWLHCGLHYQPRTPNEPLCTPPSRGEMPPLNGPDEHFRLFPLRRDEVGSPSTSVRSFRAQTEVELVGLGDRWVVELQQEAAADPPLRFCAASEKEARAWENEVRMRVAPLVQVWQLHGGMVGGGGGVGLSPGGGGGAGPTHAAVSGGSRLCTVAALAAKARGALPKDVLAGVAGVVAALTPEDAYNLAVAAGPVVGLTFASLCFAAGVIAAARGAFGAASQVAADLGVLHQKIGVFLLPTLQKMRDDNDVQVTHLMSLLGNLVADVEDLAGGLHHFMRSRRERVRHACWSSGAGLQVGSSFDNRLSKSQAVASEVVQLIGLASTDQLLAAADEASPLTSVLRARRGTLPELPPGLIVNFEGSTLPTAQLYKAVLGSKATAWAAVVAHGMGGVGKSMACLQVAHEAKQQQRFRDGVYWAQFSERTDESAFLIETRSLATAITGKVVAANDVVLATERLGEALTGKACLVVFDDVWNRTWAIALLRAMEKVAGKTTSCLLFSTRRKDIAELRLVSNAVHVNVLSGAAAEAVLLAHAKRDGANPEGKIDERVQDAVRLCGGLALAMAVMGSVIRYCGWARALEQMNGRGLLGTDLESHDISLFTPYESLRLCLQASYQLLGDKLEEREVRQKNFKALCVVRSKELLPWQALAALWNLDHWNDVVDAARVLRDRSLVSLVGEEHEESLRLGLHDLVVEFLNNRETVTLAVKEAVHMQVVDMYCKRDRIAVPPRDGRPVDEPVVRRPLWKLKPDGYIERALPHLLWSASGSGQAELRALLFDMRYIAWRVKAGAGACDLYRADVRLVGADVLDRVATVVERVLVNPRLPLDMRMHQVAFELAERVGRRSVEDAAANTADEAMRDYLGQTAQSFLPVPSVRLHGVSRMGLPLERRVLPGSTPLRAFVNACGGIVLVAVATTDPCTLNLWREETGSRLADLKGHTDSVTCVAVVEGGGGSTGARVVSGSVDNTVRVWDVDRGESTAVLEGHTRSVTCVAVVEGGGGSTGARVVSGSYDDTVRVWDVDRGESTAVLEGHKRSVTCVAVVEGGGGSTGARVVSGSYDNTVRVWDVDRGESTAVLEGHTATVTCVAVVEGGGGSTGARVVSGSVDNTVRVWDVDRGEFTAVLEGHTSCVNCVAVVEGGGGSTGARVVSGSVDNTVRVWDVDRGESTAVLEGHTRSVRCVAVVEGGGGSTGARIVSGSDDNTVRVWDVDRGESTAVLEGHTRSVTCVTVVEGGGGSTGARVVSGSADNTVRVWDVDRGVSTAVLEDYTARVRCVAVVEGGGGSTGARVVSGSYDNTMRVWDVDRGESTAVLEGHKNWVRCVAVVEGGGGSTGARVVSGSYDNTVRVWDVYRGESTAVLEGHKNWVRCVAVVEGRGGSTGARIVSGSVDNTVRVWDVDRGEATAVLEGHTRTVACVAVVEGGGGSTGARVVSGSHDNTVRVWDVDRGESTAVLEGHTAPVNCVAVVEGGGGSTGARVVSGSADNTVRVWDVDRGESTAVLEGHKRSVTCVAVVEGGGGSTGARVVSGSADNTVRVWDVDRGEATAVLEGHTGSVRCVAVVEGGGGSTGARVVSGSFDNTVRVWDVGSGSAVAVFDGVPAPWLTCALLPSTPSVCSTSAIAGRAVDSSGRRGAWGDDAGLVFVSVTGVAAFLNRELSALTHLPCPPVASVVCCPTPGCVAFGTEEGHVFLGRFSL